MNPDQFYVEVGRRIAARRKSTGLTQEALAATMGMSRPRLASIERGGQRLPLHVALTFARVLKLDGLASLLPSSGLTDAMVDNEIRVFGPSEGVSDKQLDQIGEIYRAVS
ncbi:helix-turn-helix domain-containing protein [Sphingomonas sp. Leaf21]|uniref:helix-turn-helix domain-containing protein n=1 Tax=Sphingomonas sp. Leaf21 TaxID=2876550 RepID=UPI001E62964A|nr:helix-turn-helix transcriptional regulator [Sphingomonas sp. Leaf21]